MRIKTAVPFAALCLAAACGSREQAAADSAAAATSPDSAALQTTPPQPHGPMHMVDSAAKAPLTADSPTAGRDTTRRDTTPPRQP
jgi:hypothetical protein